MMDADFSSIGFLLSIIAVVVSAFVAGALAANRHRDEQDGREDIK